MSHLIQSLENEQALAFQAWQNAKTPEEKEKTELEWRKASNQLQAQRNVEMYGHSDGNSWAGYHKRWAMGYH